MTAISFYVSATVAMFAAVFGVSARAPRHALGGFCVALAALIVPLLQLRAPLVAALMGLCAGLVVALLGGLSRLRGEHHAGSSASGAPYNAKFLVPAGLGLAGFVWCLLASGSRQVIESPPPLERAHASFGEGERALELLAGEQMVASSVVGLLALCCVIAATLTLVGEGEGER